MQMQGLFQIVSVVQQEQKKGNGKQTKPGKTKQKNKAGKTHEQWYKSWNCH